MADDHEFEIFYTEEWDTAVNAPPAVFIDEEPGMFEWQPTCFCQSTMEADDESVLHFNGDPKLLTLPGAAQGPLESANIAIHPSNSGAVGTTPSTLTGCLSSTEDSLEEVPTPKEGKDQVSKVVTEDKKPKSKTKGLAKEINHIPNIPIIWQNGDGPGAEEALWKEFHSYGSYKMDATDAESIRNTFPPKNVLLSDWWVGNILRSALGGAERGKMWPCDFNSKGHIRTSRTPKGRAYKQLGGSEDVRELYYVVFYSRFQLHGKEGLDVGRTTVRRKTQSTKSTKKIFKRGDKAELQNDDIPGAAEPDNWESKKAEAECQKTGNCMTRAKDTLLDDGKITIKRGEDHESKSGSSASTSSASTSSEERPRKKARGI